MPKTDSVPVFDDDRVRAELWRLHGVDELYRLWVTPRESVTGWVIFLPGLGDFVDRYVDWFSWMADRGWGVVAPDWPGHGRSSGKRGDAVSLELCDRVVDACMDALDSRHGSSRRAIWGHSVGGFVAIREMARAPLEWKWAWLSSPMLRPSAAANGFQRGLLPVLSKVLPSFTMDTGVRPEDCVVGKEPKKADGEGLWHHAVSARFAQSLMEQEGRMELESKRIRRGLPVMVTQGELDPVAKPEFVYDWVATLKERQVDVTLQRFEDTLHEPMFEPQVAQRLRAEMDGWLRHVGAVQGGDVDGAASGGDSVMLSGEFVRAQGDEPLQGEGDQQDQQDQQDASEESGLQAAGFDEADVAHDGADVVVTQRSPLEAAGAEELGAEEQVADVDAAMEDVDVEDVEGGEVSRSEGQG